MHVVPLTSFCEESCMSDGTEATVTWTSLLSSSSACVKRHKEPRFIPHTQWDDADAAVNVQCTTLKALLQVPSPSPCPSPPKSIIVPMMMGRLTDRLSSEPILSVSVNLTVTKTMTETAGVNGPLENAFPLILSYLSTHSTHSLSHTPSKNS